MSRLDSVILEENRPRKGNRPRTISVCRNCYRDKDWPGYTHVGEKPALMATQDPDAVEEATLYRCDECRRPLPTVLY